MNALQIIFQAYLQVVPFDLFLTIQALIFVAEFVLTFAERLDVL
jgi:hypothetical protein